jgi:hypothetical protein
LIDITPPLARKVVSPGLLDCISDDYVITLDEGQLSARSSDFAREYFLVSKKTRSAAVDLVYDYH